MVTPALKQEKYDFPHNQSKDKKKKKLRCEFTDSCPKGKALPNCDN